MNASRTFFVFLAALFLAALPAAQGEVTSTLYTRSEDGLVRAALEVEMQPGWHLYHTDLGHPAAIGRPTTVKLNGEGITWSEVVFPEPHKLPQESFDPEVTDVFVLSHEGTIVLYALGTLEDGVADLATVNAQISGLVCDDEGCIPYSETVTTQGPGPDALFAAFPAQLVPVVDEDEHEMGMADATLYTRVIDGKAWAAIEFVVEEGWHFSHTEVGHPKAVGQTATIELSGEGVQWGEPRFPEPHKFDVPDWEGVWIYGHEGTIVVQVEGEITGESFDPESVSGKLYGQTCDEGSCVPYKETVRTRGPGRDELFVPIELPGTESEDTTVSGGAIGSLEDGLWTFLLAAIGWGLFTLLMPCTYPMIPITISFFTKQADARGGRVLPLALAYGAGIVLIFILIGITLGALIVPFATHPITNLVIGLLFLYFALVLFGVVNLQPPAFLLNAAGKAAMTGGYVGVFLMGATLVVTSFTCTAPFVGSLLGLAADRSIGEVALGMGVFGATMATPFVLLSLLPGRIQALPKSGEWMNTLKVFLGFVEVAAALKFFSNSDLVWKWEILSREFYLLLWGLIFLAAALYLFGFFKGGAQKGPLRLGGAVLVLLFSFYNFWGMSGRSLDRVMTAIAPNYSGGKLMPSWWDSTREWAIVKDDYDRARELARNEEKVLLVNFTGYT